MFGIPAYGQQPIFVDVPSSASGTLAFAGITSGRSGAFLFHNFGAFAQDTWRATRALTLTYGLRWDVDFAPSSTPSLLAVTGFNLSDLSNLALASGGTPPFQTTYGNVAPRLGIAYQLSHSQQWQTVLRGGFGVFYDLATSNAGQIANNSNYPFGATKFLLGQAFGGTSTFPLSPSDAAPPVITAASLASGGKLYAFDPNLKLPYTLEWTIAVEQSLGVQQTVSVSYVGSAGRRLLQTEGANSVNANFSSANLITNVGNSDYDALQVQFQRRLSRGLQALASYTWSHSIDTASAGSGTNNANLFVPGANSNANRGPSDFDIRNAFSAGVTYEVPTPKLNAFANALLRGWSIQNLFQARSAPPVSVYDGSVFALQNFSAQVRPDVVAGQPLYLFGSQYPGGKAFNPKAFTPAPRDSNGKPVRQGDLGRNALRAFGAWQWDFAAHRDFAIRESLKLQFRAEMFNVLNHPNFAPPVSNIRTTSQFGLSTQTLGNYLAGSNIGSGAFNPLYQIGGPRSVQFALKLLF